MDKVFEDRLYILKTTIKLLSENDLINKEELMAIMTEIAYIQNGTFIVNKDQKKIEKYIICSNEYKEAIDKITFIDADEMNIKENTICPLSKKEIFNKFEGACGHIFDKMAIEEYKRMGRNNICPIPACNKPLE